jgi:hypothetical protein
LLLRKWFFYLIVTYKVSFGAGEADPSGLEMSEQNPGILRGPAHALFVGEGGSVGDPIPQIDEHAFVFPDMAGASSLSMDQPNLLVDLGRSERMKESDSDTEMRSISLTGCSYDLPSDVVGFDRLERQVIFNIA